MLAPEHLSPAQFGAIRTVEPRFRPVLERASRYARSPLPLLLLGESGTGKEMLARAVHESSAARRGPFVAVNCGGIQKSLLESELFGHAKGAFTGAVSERPGALRSAHGGTLFLDELGEAPMNLQVALLRSLETQRVRPVGSERECPIHIRIMAATSRPLGELMRTGAFRADLYHRLSGATLELPALRERECDLPLIAADLLGALRPKTTLSESACRLLQTRTFPGNIRQLKYTLERALADAAPLPGSPYELQRQDFVDESACDQELARQVTSPQAPRPWPSAAAPSTPISSGQSSESFAPAPPENSTAFSSSAPTSSLLPDHSVDGGSPLSPSERVLASHLTHLRSAAEAYLASKMLVVPGGLTRRKERAYERALLLLIAEHHSAEFSRLPRWVHDRFSRLFRAGWEKADGGQAERDVGRV